MKGEFARPETFGGFAKVRRGLLALLLLISGSVLAVGAAHHWSREQQGVLAVCLVLLGVVLLRWPRSRACTLGLLLLSGLAGWRYLLWRVHLFSALLLGTGWRPALLLCVPGLIFLLAETVLLFHGALRYVVSAWPLERRPVALPEDLAQWPAVDVVIMVGEEPTLQIRLAALAALHLDWPPDRLHLHVLEHEGREELRRFCAARGMGYLVASRESLAGGGILPNFGEQLRAPFLATFEASHPPVRSFLQLTMGWFLQQPSLALLQTRQGGATPPELHEVRRRCVEDLWDAVAAEGPAAVLRRSAWQQLSPTMASATPWFREASLQLQRRGWKTAYLSLPQVAGGLARGVTRESLRREESRLETARWLLPQLPRLWTSGFTAGQRLYLTTWAAEALLPLPRWLCFVAPLGWALLSARFLPGSATALALVAGPHLVLCLLARRRLHGSWRGVGLEAASVASLPPVTHGAAPQEASLHGELEAQGEAAGGRVAALGRWPFAGGVSFLLLTSVAAVVVALSGWLVPGGVALWRYGPTQLPGLARLFLGLTQVAWAALVLASVALGRELGQQCPQRRRLQRVPKRAAMAVLLPDGALISRGESVNVSPAGIWVRCETALPRAGGERLQLELESGSRRLRFEATVISAEGRDLRLHFRKLSLEQQEALAVAIYNRADSWLQMDDVRAESVVQLSMRGSRGLLRESFGGQGAARAWVAAWAATVVVLLTMLSGVAGLRWLTQQAAKQRAQTAMASVSMRAVKAAEHRDAESPTDARVQNGSPRGAQAATQDGMQGELLLHARRFSGEPVVLDDRTPMVRTGFALPMTALAQAATLEFRCEAASAAAGPGSLRVLLNGIDVAGAAPCGGAGGAPSVVALPPEWLVQQNEITLELDRNTPAGRSVLVDPVMRLFWRGVLLRPRVAKRPMVEAGTPALTAASTGRGGVEARTTPSTEPNGAGQRPARLQLAAWLAAVAGVGLLAFFSLWGLYLEQAQSRLRHRSS